MKKMNVENNLVLSDPCYKKNNGCNCVLSVKKGTWNTDFCREPIDDRIASILMVHENSDFEKIKNILETKTHEEKMTLCVDSGTMCICDEKYFDTIHDNKQKIEKIYDATDFYQENPDYIPYIKTDKYKKHLSEMIQRIHETLEKYNAEGNEQLLETGALDSYGLYLSAEFCIFRNDLTIKYYDENIVNEVFEKEKNNTKYSEIISSSIDLWQKKCLIYGIFVKEEIRNCVKNIGLQISKELDLNNRTKEIYMPKADIVDDKCFVSSSGYGDGCYPYYIHKDKNGDIDGIMIRFLKVEE